jgi:hypothetical protein
MQEKLNTLQFPTLAESKAGGIYVESLTTGAGRWLGLPASPAELKNLVDIISVNGTQEWIVSATDGHIGQFHEWRKNLKHLNLVAITLSLLDDDVQIKVASLIWNDKQGDMTAQELLEETQAIQIDYSLDDFARREIVNIGENLLKEISERKHDNPFTAEEFADMFEDLVKKQKLLNNYLGQFTEHGDAIIWF